jgi:CheY-like chemotaxis protein
MNIHPLILVIDDEPINFKVIESLLDGQGYQLRYVPSGRQILDQMESFHPDVILLDVMMPLDPPVFCNLS